MAAFFFDEKNKGLLLHFNWIMYLCPALLHIVVYLSTDFHIIINSYA
jgi:hypothetical protein